MNFRKLKAADGCVLFFPSRAPGGRHPQVISGPQKTRRRWAEEWVQIRLNLVALELRLEEDTAVDLGNNLRCEVVARLLTQIDDSDLSKALPKVVDTLRCSTTDNLETVLTERLFRDRLEPKFRAAVEHVVSEADYLKLLEDAGHHGQLYSSFASEATKFLAECGFALIKSEIRFRPLNPGILGAEQAITKKWIDRERAQALLEAEKDSILEGIGDDKEKEGAERKARIEQEQRAREISQKEAERDNAKRLHQLAIEMQSDENKKEKTMAEARRALEEYFNQRQETKDNYEHAREVERIKNQADLEKLRLTAEREEESARAEHQRRAERTRFEHQCLMQEQIATQLVKDLEIEKIRLEVKKLEAEQATVSGLAEAQVIEARVKAVHILQQQQIAAMSTWLERLVDNLPEIVAKSSASGSADRTVIHFGGEVQPDLFQDPASIIAVALLPMLKKVMAGLSDYVSVSTVDREQQSSATLPEDDSQDRDRGAHSMDAKTSGLATEADSGM